MKINKLLLPVLILACSITPAVQCQTLAVAPPGDVLRVGHLGRETGDLERIIHFYHDLLGLGLRGERNAPRPFWSSPGLIDFANTPKYAEFRAVIMPIPGTSASSDAGNGMTIEAIEFRNMERHQYVQNVSDIGGSHLVLILRDLDKTLALLKAEGVPIITTGGEPVELQLWSPHRERAIIVRDPDGYPVELNEPLPRTATTDDSNILGAGIAVTVKDLDTTLHLYKDLVNPEWNIVANADFTKNEGLNKLWNTPGAEYREGGFMIPGSPVALRFFQFRNIEQKMIKPILQDIGVAHVLFMAKDLDVIMPRIRAAGLHVLATSGEPVFIAPRVRAVFVPDPNHFFMEFMERIPDEEVRTPTGK